MKDRRQNKERRTYPQFKLPDDARGNSDRRQKERRVNERIPIKMWVRNIDGDADYFQQTGNLSSDGVYIFSPSPYSTGTVIDLEFQVPTTDYIVKCSGEILQYTEEDQLFGLSVKFLGLSKYDKQIIHKIVEEIAKTVNES